MLLTFWIICFVVLICAGWNAEGRQITSMKEIWCAKHISLCRVTPQILSDRRRWILDVVGNMNMFWRLNQTCYTKQMSAITKSYNESRLRHCVNQPHVHFTMMRCAKRISCACWRPERWRRIDYQSWQHIVPIFWYILLFVENRICLDIKSCFLELLSCLLSACQSCSALTCIVAGAFHIH